MVVDNDPATGELIADLLREVGYTTKVASTFGDGAAIAKAHRPDLAIIDPTLRGGDGRELVRRVLSYGARVVITSARHDAPAIAEALGLPLLPKPFGFDELHALIATLDSEGREALS